MTIRLVLDGKEMADVLRSPNGPVMRDLMRRAQRVQVAAQAQVKATTKGSGKLASAIVKRPGFEGPNPKMMVGCWSAPYAVFVHNGTKPHDIRPVNKKALAFNWPGHGPVTTVKVGRASKKHPGGKVRDVNTVLAVVHHPGTKPNPFLSDNLHHAVD